ncbi:MAG: tetratricopeptide (TPR) repeat protein [Lysobacterales bacterium]|jgi:tetratricopeptide (TPR) repeat protein
MNDIPDTGTRQQQIVLLFNQALAAFNEGDLEKSIGLCTQLESISSKEPGVYNLKALILARQGKLEDAVQTIDKAITLKPADPSIHYNAARLNNSILRHEAAIRHAQTACEISPESSTYLYQLAVVYREANKFEKSIEAIDRCLYRYPDFEEAWLLKADNQSDIGDRDSASESYRMANTIGAPSARAVSALSRIHRTPLSDSEIIGQLESIKNGKGSADDISCATFALASIYQREKLFEKSFELYQHANKFARSTRPFDIGDYERRVDETINASDNYPETARQAKHSGLEPVFIVGMPRSGSSLCEQVVSSHSQVYGCGELATMIQLERRINNLDVNYYLYSDEQAPPQELLEQARTDYFATITGDLTEARWVTDKQLFNFERIGLIHRLFPAARVLYCTRHPLDTILSCFMQNFESVRFASSLDDIARVYVCHLRLMRHWNTRLPGIIHQVSYPALVSDLESEARTMADFLGLGVEPLMFEPHKNPQQMLTASKWQVREPVYNSSIDVWKNYHQHVEPVIAYLQAQGVLDENAEPTAIFA